MISLTQVSWDCFHSVAPTRLAPLVDTGDLGQGTGIAVLPTDVDDIEMRTVDIKLRVCWVRKHVLKPYEILSGWGSFRYSKVPLFTISAKPTNEDNTAYTIYIKCSPNSLELVVHAFVFRNAEI
jgi:hypothetical protein